MAGVFCCTDDVWSVWLSLSPFDWHLGSNTFINFSTWLTYKSSGVFFHLMSSPTVDVYLVDDSSFSVHSPSMKEAPPSQSPFFFLFFSSHQVVDTTSQSGLWKVSLFPHVEFWSGFLFLSRLRYQYHQRLSQPTTQ